jgi:hypothetical protein
MWHRRAICLAVPAMTALLGAGAAPQAVAQTLVTTPGQVTQTTTTVMAPTAPPPPQTEAVPPPPTGATVTTYWQPGHCNWNGASWVWVDGSYMQRVQQPTATAVWVPGQWVQQSGGGYVWVVGHWQT